MKVSILCPAPRGKMMTRWGDYHFADSLKRAFEAKNHSVSVIFWPDWKEELPGADLLLVLRGLRKAENIAGKFEKRIIWILSHPDEVTESELQQFDHVFSASHRHAEALSKRGIPAAGLLQCTDAGRFRLRARPNREFDNQFVFVGNTRNTTRGLIERLAETNLPLKIWGYGWDRSRLARCLQGEYFPNEDLPDLYRSSLFCVNDHWSDMARLGFVNNRVFDSLACGLPVVMYAINGIRDLGFGGATIIDDKTDLDDQIDNCLVRYEEIQDAVYMDADTISECHTFDKRVEEILAVID